MWQFLGEWCSVCKRTLHIHMCIIVTKSKINMGRQCIAEQSAEASGLQACRCTQPSKPPKPPKRAPRGRVDHPSISPYGGWYAVEPAESTMGMGFWPKWLSMGGTIPHAQPLHRCGDERRIRRCTCRRIRHPWNIACGAPGTQKCSNLELRD